LSGLKISISIAPTMQMLPRRFGGARRALRGRTGAGELSVEVPALASPQIGETADVYATPSGLWAFADLSGAWQDN
jgi:hypothetical protein